MVGSHWRSACRRNIDDWAIKIIYNIVCQNFFPIGINYRILPMAINLVETMIAGRPHELTLEWYNNYSRQSTAVNLVFGELNCCQNAFPIKVFLTSLNANFYSMWMDGGATLMITSISSIWAPNHFF